MKTYVKPEMTIEKFLLNNSVASVSCEKDLVESVITFNPQEVTCAFSGDKEYVWTQDAGGGCNRTALAIGYFQEGMSAEDIQAALRNSQASTYVRKGQNTSSLGAGYYVYLIDERGNDCVALATPGVLNYYTNS